MTSSGPPGVRRQGRGAVRERAIVTAAAELIAEKGLANVRMSDVAERAAMGTGHVTYYFPSRTHLLVQAIRQSEDSYAQALARRTDAIIDPWEKLATFIELSLADGPRDRGWMLWFEVWALASREPEVARLRDELSGRSIAVLRGLIEAGCEAGAFTATDPQEVATLLSATIDGLSIQLTLGAEPPPTPDVVARCVKAARALLSD